MGAALRFGLVLGVCVSGLSTLCAADVSYNEVRTALFNQNYTQARELLDAANADSSEREQLLTLLDECELAAACDDATAYLEASAARDDNQDPALQVLIEAYQRCSHAHASTSRARGLIAILGGEAATPTVDAKLLKQLQEALETDKAQNEKRLTYVAEVTKLSQQALIEARDALSAASQAAQEHKIFVAQQGYQLVQNRCEGARELMQTLKPYLDPLEYSQASGQVEVQADTMVFESCHGLALTYLDARDFVKAAQAAERGLLVRSDDSELLELRVKIEELWKLDIFGGE